MMLQPRFLALGMLIACALYVWGLFHWIFFGKKWAGALALLGAFPALVFLSAGTWGIYLRAIPLIGIAMFALRERTKILRSIHLLWFTTLTVLVVHLYYLWVGLY
jgi:hypothetical protein